MTFELSSQIPDPLFQDRDVIHGRPHKPRQTILGLKKHKNGEKEHCLDRSR